MEVEVTPSTGVLLGGARTAAVVLCPLAIKVVQMSTDQALEGSYFQEEHDFVCVQWAEATWRPAAVKARDVKTFMLNR